MHRILTGSTIWFALLFAPAWTGGSASGAPPVNDKGPANYRDIVKQVLPAVVDIESQAHSLSKATLKKQSEQSPEQALDQDLPDELRHFLEMFPKHRAHGRGQMEQPRLGSGSGFIIDPSGVVVTAYHVVQGADRVTVKLQDGRRFISKNIKSDPMTDLAIVRIETKEKLPALQWGDSSAMDIGDRVLAVGAPFGLGGTVTQGIVSGKGRSLRLNRYEDFIQTDAAINPGNSGGPLVNLEGKVIGVNSVIKTMSGGFQGIGLAVSSDLARQIVDELLKSGTVKRGFLGVQISMLSPEIGARLGLKDQRGLLVAKVFANSPAAKAGLKEGDIITAWDGKAIESPTTLSFAVARHPVGKPAELGVWHDGKATKLEVTIAQQPAQFGSNEGSEERPATAENGRTWMQNLGVAVSDLTKENRNVWGCRKAPRARSSPMSKLAALRRMPVCKAAS